MHILFIHRAFPAQFGHLGFELHQRYGWQCSFLVENLTACPPPTPEMLANLAIHRLKLPPELASRKLIPWAQHYGRYLQLCAAVADTVRGLPHLRPDLVVCHDGLGPALFLPDLLPCPVVNYCEYYFAKERCDLTYRIDL